MPDSLLANARIAEIGDIELAYLEEGSGAPVVLIHGSASDLRIWRHQLPVLGRHYRVLAYSRRYAHPNATIAPGLDDPMAPHVDDLLAFLDATGARPAHLVGHSWGGFVALLATIRDPGAVRSLTLLEPPVLPLVAGAPPSPLRLLQSFVRRPRTAAAAMRFVATTVVPAQRAFRRGDDEEAMRRFSEGVMGKAAAEASAPEELEAMRDNVTSARAQLLGKGFPPLRDDDVRRVEVPTLLVTGRETPAFLRLLSDRLAELLPHAEGVEIPDASHCMQVDQPERTNAALLAFLARHEATA